jgi:signal transduction histidine kinase
VKSGLKARTEHLLLALLLTVLWPVGLALLIGIVVSMALIVVWVGLPLTLVGLILLRQFARVHRYFAARLLGIELPGAYLRVDERNLLRRPMAIARDRSTWRDLLWLVVTTATGLALGLAALFESIVGLVLWWPKYFALLVDAHLIAALLAPTEKAQLAIRVQELTESRAETVDTQAAELRRIERDLHDGAQARMVSLGMSIGLAEERLERDPAGARHLLAEARATNVEALAELRALVRGIHPPVLADRGLVGAVQALVLATPLPIDLQMTLPDRLPAPVESAAYFAVAEVLANVIKHSQARTASVTVTAVDGLLTLYIVDDGIGGADLSAGTGLRGIERRLSAFDGTMVVESPIGGPSTVTMVVPFMALR